MTNIILFLFDNFIYMILQIEIELTYKFLFIHDYGNIAESLKKNSKLNNFLFTNCNRLKPLRIKHKHKKTQISLNKLKYLEGESIIMYILQSLVTCSEQFLLRFYFYLDNLSNFCSSRSIYFNFVHTE